MGIHSIIGDIRDADGVKKAFKEHRPEIVFHCAAQPIVRLSFKDPIETFSSNVMGTICVFEASRACGAVRAIVNITSDKCYENREWAWPYREVDRLGGYDPYSASKACAEIVTGCYRDSYFNIEHFGRTHNTLLASARAGNVIGGGDWAVDRLVPDIMRCVNLREKVKIRNPQAIRPWQHVLESLSGYLLLGKKLLEGRKEFAGAWNFGPSDECDASVESIARQAKKSWPAIDYEIQTVPDQAHEAGMLKLDCSKARAMLQWAPVWNRETAVEKTVLWYKSFYESKLVQSSGDLESYVSDAKKEQSPWVQE
jgi:CDP-glucose 4,6-dehydratase